MNRLFALLIIAVSLSGCAAGQINPPQRFELCANYVVYDSVESYRHHAPGTYKERIGYYSPSWNELHIIRDEPASWYHEGKHAASIKGYPEPLKLDKADDHFYQWAQPYIKWRQYGGGDKRGR